MVGVDGQVWLAGTHGVWQQLAPGSWRVVAAAAAPLGAVRQLLVRERALLVAAAGGLFAAERGGNATQLTRVELGAAWAGCAAASVAAARDELAVGLDCAARGGALARRRGDGAWWTIAAPGVIDGVPQAMAFDAAGTLWLADGGVLHAQRAGERRVRRFSVAAGLPVNGTTALAVSADGFVFVGLQTGVLRLPVAALDAPSSHWKLLRGARWLPGGRPGADFFRGQDVAQLVAIDDGTSGALGPYGQPLSGAVLALTDGGVAMCVVFVALPLLCRAHNLHR